MTGAASDAESGGATLLRVLTADPAGPLAETAAKHLLARLPNRWAALRSRPELDQLAGRLLGNAAQQQTGIQLVVAGELAGRVDTLIGLAKDQATAAPVRSAAVQALAAFKAKPPV